MRLNLVNIPSLVGTGLSNVVCGEFNPKFGSKVGINSDLFKYVIPGPPKEVFMFQRVSLNELFDGIPQSIVGVVRRDWSDPSVEEITEELGVDLVTQESPVMDIEAEELNELGELFTTWVHYIGLGGLTLAEVELSTDGDWLYVDASRSTVFKGSVSIKVKEAE